MTVKAYGTNVVCKLLEDAEKKTAGGILIQSGIELQEHSRRAEVISIGPLLNKKELEDGVPPLRVGDVVYYRFHGGVKVITPDGDYVVLQYQEVLAIE